MIKIIDRYRYWVLKVIQTEYSAPIVDLNEKNERYYLWDRDKQKWLSRGRKDNNLAIGFKDLRQVKKMLQKILIAEKL